MTEPTVVTITFGRKPQTETFRIWRREDLTQDERSELISLGARVIRKSDWADEDFEYDHEPEAKAAAAAGLSRGAEFVYLTSDARGAWQVAPIAGR